MHVQTQNVKSVIEPSSSGEALELLLGAGLKEYLAYMTAIRHFIAA